MFQAAGDEPPAAKTDESPGPNPLAVVAELLRGATQSYRLLDLEWDPEDNDGYLPGYGAPLNEMPTLGPGAFQECSALSTLWGYQMAVEVPLRMNTRSKMERPAYILVDVVSYDAAGQVVDSLRSLVFQRAKGSNESRDIWYRSDVRRPLVITHGFDAPKDCPDLMAIRYMDGGDFDVVISDSRPQKPLSDIERASSHVPTQAGLFGDLTRRMTRESANEIADCLDIFGRLPPGVFEKLAPEIIRVLDCARPGHLRSKALQVLCEKGNDRVAELVALYMNECVERYTNRSRHSVNQREFHRSVGHVVDFVGSDLSLWGPAFRDSPAIRSFLMRLATWPGKGLHTTEIMTAVDTLIELTPTTDARRAMLLDIVRQEGAGYGTAASRLIPLADKPTLASLRSMAAKTERNWSIIVVLAHCGDVESLPMLRQLREKAGAAEDRSLPGMLDDEIQKIELQNPPQDLIAYIRDDFGGRNWYWAIRRALEFKVDKEAIRSAILKGAPNGKSLEIAACREFALKLDVLRPGDLAEAGHYYSLGGGCTDGGVYRRKGRVILPGSQEKKRAWSAGDDDIKAFSEWFESQQFESIPKDRADSCLLEGLCKHHLLPPRFCN